MNPCRESNGIFHYFRFVLTQTKDSPLAQVIIQSPKPDAPENATMPLLGRMVWVDLR